jgi:putative solute:sodium symporter small subunit
MSNSNHRQGYWQDNITLIRTLLFFWALVSLGMSILLVKPLNNLHIWPGQVPFGFWMAQQGSIYGFVALIFIYAKQMDRLDRKYNQNRGPK